MLRIGRTSTSGLVHVDDERGEALVLRRVGVGAGEQQAALRLVRHRGPDLLSRSRPTRRRRATARVASPATSDPAPGSLNSWHQISSAVKIGRRKRLALLLGAAGHDGGPAHADAHGVAHPRVATARLLERGVDDLLQLRDGVEAAVARRGSPCGPARHRTARRGTWSCRRRRARRAIARPGGAPLLP